MFKITADFVKRELRKISFFVQYSGLLDELPVKIRNKIEDMPIEWTEAPKFEGEWLPKWEEDETKKVWKEAFLTGKMGEDEIKLHIVRDDDRYEYSLIYKGKKYKTNNLTKLQNTAKSLQTGEKPLQQKLSETWKMIKNRKGEIRNYIKHHYLRTVSPKEWDLKTQKDTSRIYLRFWVNVDDPEEIKQIKEKLVEHQYHRVYSAISYLKILIKRLNIDPNTLSFKPSLIETPNQAGFKVTIK